MVGFFMLDLLGPPSRSIDRDAKGHVDSDNPAQEVSERKNISEWPQDHSYDILLENVVAFCSCPLPKAKVKNFGLMELTEEISRQPSIDCCHVVS